jgi:hypothetical protein
MEMLHAVVVYLGRDKEYLDPWYYSMYTTFMKPRQKFLQVLLVFRLCANEGMMLCRRICNARTL